MASARQIAVELGIRENTGLTTESPWTDQYKDLTETLDAMRRGGQARLGINDQADPWYDKSATGPDTFCYYTPDQENQLIAHNKMRKGEEYQLLGKSSRLVQSGQRKFDHLVTILPVRGGEVRWDAERGSRVRALALPRR
jgi:hypothetical protein